MKGFFPASQVQSRSVNEGLIPKCGQCGLFKTCQSPKMKPYGDGRRKVLIVGEAPGCVSGETLVETAFRDKSKNPDGIPIRDLVGVKGIFVYCFSVRHQRLEIGRVKKVWRTGFKKVYRVTYVWLDGRGNEKFNSIKVTRNHRFLIKRTIKHDPNRGLDSEREYLSLDGGLSVGHSIQPFHRLVIKGYGRVGAFANKMFREPKYLLEFKEGRILEDGENTHHIDENKLNDGWDNLERLTVEDHWRHHASKSNPMHKSKFKKRHLVAVSQESYRNGQSERMRSHLSNPEAYKKRVDQIHAQSERTSQTLKEKYKQPDFYYRYLLNRGLSDEWVLKKFKSKFPNERIPLDNHKIVSIEYVGVEDVYDMEVENFHNFAANGIFVHNSTEDEEGRPFIGKAGQFLRDSLRQIGVNLDRDCLTTNANICRPINNETPDAKKIAYCRPNLVETIRDFEPNVIVTLGANALHSVIRECWAGKIGTLERWIGWQIPYSKFWICPTYHPSFLLRMKNQTMDRIFKEHLQSAFEIKITPPKSINFESKVEILYDDEEVYSALSDFDRAGGWVVFDYEGNCLKPEYPKGKLYSCAVASKDRIISYPWIGKAIEATGKLLKSKRTKKIAFNMKMEERWTRKVFGFGVSNWGFDPMLATHCLDNRKGICSLKFQALVRLGVPTSEYNERITPYLESHKGHYNRIQEIDLRQLLLYGGIDCGVTRRLASLQMKELTND